MLFELAVDELESSLAAMYFPPWIPDDRSESQLRRSWIRKALEMLENIGMAKKLADNETYELSPLSAKQKDFSADIYRKVAKFRSRRRESQLLSATGRKQRELTNSLSNLG